MSDEPMWAINKNGAYCLLFLNKFALSISNIKEIFSKFGNVINVTSTGNKTGYRFVEYSNVEDAENAVKKLKDYKTIELIQYRVKKRTSNECTNNSNNKENGNSRNKANGNSRIKENDNSKIAPSQSHKKYSDKNFNGRKVMKDSIDKNKKSSSNNKIELKNKSNKKQITSIAPNNLHCVTSKSMCNSTILNDKINLDNEISPKAQKFINSNIKDVTLVDPVSKPKSQNLLKLERIKTNASSVDLCNSKLSNTFCDASVDKIPDLLKKKHLDIQKESEKLILNAEEIIVANIHEHYGSAYILHLFDQFKILAITHIKELPRVKIRYCHVYFKTLHDSTRAETQFDKYNLSGKKLVVLRPCKLMEEAMSDD